MPRFTALEFRVGLIAHLLLLVPLSGPVPSSSWKANAGAVTATGIEDQVLLDESVFIDPISSTTEEEFTIFLFDLTGLPLVENNTFNDLILTYTTPHSNDGDVWIFNYQTGVWDRIGYDGGAGLTFFTDQTHLISAIGLKPKNFLHPTEDWAKIRSRNWYRILAPQLKAAVINTDYNSFPLVVPIPLVIPIELGFDLHDVARFSGLTFANGSLYATSDEDKIYEISVDGEFISEVSVEMRLDHSLAYDGSNLWGVRSHRSGSRDVVKLDLEGNVICDASIPTQHDGGLAYGKNSDGEETLWLSERRNSREPEFLFEIDPLESCVESKSAVIRAQYEIPFDGSSGLAWNGHHLIMSTSNQIHIVNTDGQVLESYDTPLRRTIGDIAWDSDSETLFVLNNGLEEIGNRDQVISRFKLPTLPGTPKPPVGGSGIRLR